MSASCHAFPSHLSTQVRLARAKQFIDEAIAKGGCVLVHCNGARHLCCPRLGVSHVRPNVTPRRDQPFTLLCGDVRDAVLLAVLGGRVAPRAEPPLLHFAEWWLHDPNQGKTPSVRHALRAQLIWRCCRNTSPSTRRRMRSLLTRSSALSRCAGSARTRTTRITCKGIDSTILSASTSRMLTLCLDVHREGERTKRFLMDEDEDDAMET